MSAVRPRLLVAALTACSLAGAGLAASAAPSETAPLPIARAAAPVVLTGAQLPGWSSPAAVGVAQPYPSGMTGDYSKGIPKQLGSYAIRSAHNGTLAPTVTEGVPVDEVAAYSWTGKAWQEVPVQVDERFPHFLANARSDFGFYSGTDQELTYAWAPTAHTNGEEAWKKVFGQCDARYALNDAEVAQAIASGVVTLGPQEQLKDYQQAMSDPAVGLDDDDEIALQSRDAGEQAPAGTAPPAGATSGQVVALA